MSHSPHEIIVCLYCMGTGRQDQRTGAPVGYTGEARKCPHCHGVGTVALSKVIF